MVIMKELNPKSLEYIFLWSDGTWCYREDYLNGDYNWLSDDFEIISVYSNEYDEFFKKELGND